jgi:hypothetical protein
MKVDLLLYIREEATPILIQGAVVRWSSQHGIGIEFQSLTSPDRERLDCTIQQLEATAGHS